MVTFDDRLEANQDKPLRTHVLQAAPAMPLTYWGSVVYEYQAGKLVMAKIEERLKPVTP